jgi:trans-aconitate methyltransferase
MKFKCHETVNWTPRDISRLILKSLDEQYEADHQKQFSRVMKHLSSLCAKQFPDTTATTYLGVTTIWYNSQVLKIQETRKRN